MKRLLPSGPLMEQPMPARGRGGAVQGQGGAAHLAGLGDDAVLTVWNKF